MAAGIEYSEAGTGEAIICLHGIGGDATSFDPQLAGLTGKRVISWSMPGYAGSPPRELTFE
ncbi:MAG: alpha/beta fold hydrolase, partial [Pikeienuella sp.]